MSGSQSAPYQPESTLPYTEWQDDKVRATHHDEVEWDDKKDITEMQDMYFLTKRGMGFVALNGIMFRLENLANLQGTQGPETSSLYQRGKAGKVAVGDRIIAGGVAYDITGIQVREDPLRTLKGERKEAAGKNPFDAAREEIGESLARRRAAGK